MLTIAANPGYALIAGAVLALASPKAARGWVMALAPIVCLVLIFWDRFGDYRGFTQVGLEIVQLRLDALSQIFGLTFALGALLVGVAAGHRRDRYEDAAILAMAGGATTAVFSGDLIGFIAAAELSSLAGAWIVLSSGGGRPAHQSGVRLLIWQGLGGLLLLCGVAFHLADGFQNVFASLPADSLGGAFFLAGLAIKAGAPLVHVWVKDALAQASPAGAAALSVFSVKLALYALARGYAGEPLLAPFGAALAVLGALFALAEDDLRRALAYSLLSQIGLAIAALGSAAAPGVAAAAAHAFTTAMAYLVLFLGMGAVLMRTGTARASQLGGLAQSMPVTALFFTVGALAAAGMPFLAVHLSAEMIQDAVRAPVAGWIEFALRGAAAATVAFAGVRLPLVVFFAPPRGAVAVEAPFAFLLPMSVSAFLLGAVGVAPSWLVGLGPPLGEQPDLLSPLRTIAQFEFVAGAALAYGCLALLGMARSRRPRHLSDIDVLYRGPVTVSVRWLGNLVLRVYEGAKHAAAIRFRQLERLISAGTRAADRAFSTQAVSAAGALAVFLMMGLILLLSVS